LGDRMFIVDAGSGFIKAGEALMGHVPARIDILFSHLHHDHVSGFPFFAPALAGHCGIHTHCGNLGGASAQHALDTMFAPPLFPVMLKMFPTRFEHYGFKAGETLRFGAIEIATCPLSHPGNSTGYRFEHGGRSVCYISDVEHADPWPAPHLVRFCRGADLVIYDCMYTAAEYSCFKGWGHSTWNAGLALCQAAGAKRMAAFHHNPLHNDRALDAMQAEIEAASPGSFVAREGQTLVFSPQRALAAAEVL
jgi:phosphoribosyl 1,2-cyclic phosphodiesterase